MLAHLPTLPLIIQVDQVDRDRNIEEILFALEQHNRIRCIHVELSLRVLQKFVMAIDGELPIHEHLVMMTGPMATDTEDDATFVLPETIQAPHLRLLTLHCPSNRILISHNCHGPRHTLPLHTRLIHLLKCVPVDFVLASTRGAHDLQR